MSIRMPLLVVLLFTATAAAQNSEQDLSAAYTKEDLEKLKGEGAEFLDGLPEIPDGLKVERFYEAFYKKKSVGWMEVKLEASTVDGKRCYKLTQKYAVDVVNGPLQDGTTSVAVDRKLSPIACEHRYTHVSGAQGSREVQRVFKLKGKDFELDQVDNGLRDVSKIKRPKDAHVFIADMFGELFPMKDGQKFALTDFDNQTYKTRVRVFEAEKQKKGRLRIKMSEPLIKVPVDEATGEPQGGTKPKKGRKKKGESEEAEARPRDPSVEYQIRDKDGRVVEFGVEGSFISKISTKKRVDEIKKKLGS